MSNRDRRLSFIPRTSQGIHKIKFSLVNHSMDLCFICTVTTGHNCLFFINNTTGMTYWNLVFGEGCRFSKQRDGQVSAEQSDRISSGSRIQFKAFCSFSKPLNQK